jgi:hypothetical protein
MIIFIAYGALLGVMFSACWARHRDIFHPWILLIPQFIFLYGLFPIASFQNDPERFIAYAGGEDSLLWYQLLTFFLPLCLLVGVSAGTRGIPSATARWQPRVIGNERAIRSVALIFGAMAMAGWLLMISSVGGLEAAYGAGYGGGWDDSGYIREMPYIGMVGVLLVFLLRVNKGMRSVDWVLVIFCASPVLLHGLLGARRGPTFMAAILVVGGYFYFMRKRVSLIFALPAGIMLGVLMLFLVVNRGDIYLGSEFSGLRSPFEFLEQWDASEYLIGSAVVRYADAHGGYYGAKELTHILSRLMPKMIWPSVYEDISAFFGLEIDFTINAGINPTAIYNVTGWTPSQGSAVGFVGAVWLEFQYVAPVVAFLFGYVYGVAWRKASTNVTARLIYLLLIALSVYLVMQDLDAWLFRVLLLGVPLILTSRLLRVRNPPHAHRLSAPLSVLEANRTT